MTPPDGLVRWQIQRRPYGPFLIWISVLGLVLAGGSALLVQSLMVEPSPWLATAIGAGLGLFLVLSVGQGTTVRIETGARLVYALRGQDSVVVDLRRVVGFRPIASGMLNGIGVEVPLDALTFVGRKGVSRRQCEQTQAGLGVSLVLEFLRPEDLAPLVAAWHAALAE